MIPVCPLSCNFALRRRYLLLLFHRRRGYSWCVLVQHFLPSIEPSVRNLLGTDTCIFEWFQDFFCVIVEFLTNWYDDSLTRCEPERGKTPAKCRSETDKNVHACWKRGTVNTEWESLLPSWSVYSRLNQGTCKVELVSSKSEPWPIADHICTSILDHKMPHFPTSTNGTPGLYQCFFWLSPFQSRGSLSTYFFPSHSFEYFESRNWTFQYQNFEIVFIHFYYIHKFSLKLFFSTINMCIIHTHRSYRMRPNSNQNPHIDNNAHILQILQANHGSFLNGIIDFVGDEDSS